MSLPRASAQRQRNHPQTDPVLPSHAAIFFPLKPSDIAAKANAPLLLTIMPET